MSHSNLPENVIYTLLLKSDIETVIDLLQTDTRLSQVAGTSYVIDRLAEVYRLSYSKSLVELVQYSLMDPLKLLVEAAKVGDLRVVVSIVNNYITDNLTGRYREALIYAASGGHLDIVNVLINI